MMYIPYTIKTMKSYEGQMYPVELEIKDKTESNTFTSSLDLLLSIGRDGQVHTSICDRRDDFNFHIRNFPFLISNFPSSPAYGVFIYKNNLLLRYIHHLNHTSTDLDLICTSRILNPY